MFDLGDLVTLGASQRAGALFGVADISNGDIVVQGGTYKSRLASGKDGTAPGSYGGLAGKVFATAKGDNDVLRAFVVQKDADNKNACSIEFDLASGLSHAGGVVGYVGDTTNSNSQPVAVVLNGVKVACKGDASARTTTGKLGGAVGVVDTRGVLDAAVSFWRAELTVRYDPQIVTEAELRRVLSDCGYPACEKGAPGSNPLRNALKSALGRRPEG